MAYSYDSKETTYMCSRCDSYTSNFNAKLGKHICLTCESTLKAENRNDRIDSILESKSIFSKIKSIFS